MATEAKPTAAARDQGRLLYRLTGRQVLKMIEHGIIPDEVDVELWDGVLYTMTKGEPHNFVVGVLADMLRPVTPKGYHVREEKSVRHGAFSLPEPDVAVARRPLRAYQTVHPKLEDVALVVEVCQSTENADRVVKPRRYAEVGIPVYWLVDVPGRQVEVHTRPAGRGRQARYTSAERYGIGQDFPVVIDGREVARFSVADVLPDETAPQGSDPSREGA